MGPLHAGEDGQKLCTCEIRPSVVGEWTKGPSREEESGRVRSVMRERCGGNPIHDVG